MENILKIFLRSSIRKSLKKYIALLISGALACASLSGCNGNEEVVYATESTTYEDDDFSVHFIDVGQGDSTLIICGDKSLLIDAGENDKGEYVLDYLKSVGVNKINYLIGTHPDSDHIGGIDTVIKNIDVNTFYMPEKASDTKTYRDVLDAAKEEKLSITVPKAGDTFNLNGAKCEIIGPVRMYDDNNNNSIVVKVTYNGRSFLFMGDAEKEAEADILDKISNVDVLKVGHHGSKTSTGKDFLSKVSPEIVVISCGANNDYGHPHRETMDKLGNMSIYRTDLSGNIVLYVEGNEITTKNIATVQEEKIETYILNTNSKKFHLESCDNASKISDKNKDSFTGDRSELIKKGYEACKSCKP